MREELERLGQERAERVERWLNNLEVLVTDDASVVCVRGEQRQHVGQLPEVVEALPDDLLRDLESIGDRVDVVDARDPLTVDPGAR